AVDPRVRSSFPPRRSSDLGGHLPLAAEARQARVVEPPERELERDLAPALAVARAVDHSHAAAAELGQELEAGDVTERRGAHLGRDRKSTRLNSSHVKISYA